jgi:hypothetical protein
MTILSGGTTVVQASGTILRQNRASDILTIDIPKTN